MKFTSLCWKRTNNFHEATCNTDLYVLFFFYNNAVLDQYYIRGKTKSQETLPIAPAGSSYSYDPRRGKRVGKTHRIGQV